MKALWLGMYDRGNLSAERVHFRTSADVDLVRYIVLDTIYIGPANIQASQKTCFWLPQQLIKAGENVVLYTRIGNSSREERPDGSVYHFLFRGLTSPLYTRPESCAVLFEISDWATTK